MRWIVTGALGFIGKNLILRLLANGDYVVGIDRKSLEAESVFAKELERVGTENFELHQTDMTEPLNLKFGRWFSTDGFAEHDVLVHLAARSGIKECYEDFSGALSDNIFVTANLLQGAAEYGISRFVFASSGAVVGNALLTHTTEGSAIQPSNVYGGMKAAAEQLCRGFWAEHGLQSTILRFSNVYGPHSQHKQSVANRFIRDALAGKTLEVHGDGTQRRDFVFVEDVVEAIIAGGVQEFQVPEPQVFHVSSGQETAILHDATGSSLYDVICEALGGEELPFVLVDSDPGVKAASLDSQKLRVVCSLDDPKPLSYGIKQTVRWYQQLALGVASNLKNPHDA